MASNGDGSRCDRDVPRPALAGQAGVGRFTYLWGGIITGRNANKKAGLLLTLLFYSVIEFWDLTRYKAAAFMLRLLDIENISSPY